VLGRAAPGLACTSCPNWEKADAMARESAVAIFLGTVSSAADESECQRPVCPRIYTFTVDRAWRGVHEPSVSLRSRGNFCDAVFQEGERYLVYTKARVGDHFPAQLCGTTFSVANPSGEPGPLGEPEYVAPSSPR
jgi:hypothetical protein